MSTEFTWKCEKWADCNCCPSRPQCNCGSTCGCGTVATDDVKGAINTECEKVDCGCGMYCRCGKGQCNCGGSTLKNQDQWVEFTKALKDSTTRTCRCDQDDAGKCQCASACTCADSAA